MFCKNCNFISIQEIRDLAALSILGLNCTVVDLLMLLEPELCAFPPKILRKAHFDMKKSMYVKKKEFCEFFKIKNREQEKVNA